MSRPIFSRKCFKRSPSDSNGLFAETNGYAIFVTVESYEMLARFYGTTPTRSNVSSVPTFYSIFFFSLFVTSVLLM